MEKDAKYIYDRCPPPQSDWPAQPIIIIIIIIIFFFLFIEDAKLGTKDKYCRQNRVYASSKFQHCIFQHEALGQLHVP